MLRLFTLNFPTPGITHTRAMLRFLLPAAAQKCSAALSLTTSRSEHLNIPSGLQQLGLQCALSTRNSCFGAGGKPLSAVHASLVTVVINSDSGGGVEGLHVVDRILLRCLLVPMVASAIYKFKNMITMTDFLLREGTHFAAYIQAIAAHESIAVFRADVTLFALGTVTQAAGITYKTVEKSYSTTNLPHTY